MTLRRPVAAAWALAAALSVAPALSAGAAGVEPGSPATDAEVDRALARVLPALVNLSLVSEQFAEGRAQRFRVAGSGVVVTGQGHVLTNFHVAGDAVRIRGTLATGEVLDGEVVVHDPATDLSVLRLLPREARVFAHAELGDSASLRPGDPVLAMGNPFALASSVTLGIVSNPRRVFTDAAGSEMVPVDLGVGETAGLLTPWIQHDALILPGNSGGPLVDLAGRVVGINELGGSGMGFAIPARVAAEVLRQALERGAVRRSWIGVSILPVEKLGRTRGALVSAVVPDSPAERSGVTPGDLLLELAGEPVEVRFFEQVPDFHQRVAKLAVGGEVTLRLERNGIAREVALRTEAAERGRGEEGEFRSLGLTAQEVTGPMVLAARLVAREGLLITGLRAGAPATRARPQIRPGDVLLSVAGRRLARLSDLAAVLEAVGARMVLLELRRGMESILVTVDPAPAAVRGWGGELPRAWLGARTQVVTPELAAALGAPARQGFRVTEVIPGTPAERAGLRAGDLLTALDGEPLAAARVQDAEDLERRLEERPIGSVASLELVRAGALAASPVTLAVELEARPADPGDARRERDDELEIAVRDLTRFDRIRLRLDEPQRGALVVDAPAGGWAQLAGVRTDDLVLRVGRREIGDARELVAALAALRAAGVCTVELFVRRGPLTQFLFLEPVRPGAPCRDATPSPSSPSS